MGSEVVALACNQERPPANPGGRRELGIDGHAAYERSGVEDDVVTPRLMVVRESRVVETVESHDHLVSAEPPGRQKVRALDEQFPVVALFLPADAAEHRRPVAAAGGVHEQSTLDPIPRFCT